jgi:hypothetical protein
MIPRSELDFLPRIQWRFWLPVLSVVIGFPLVWMLMRARELDQRRDALLREHGARTGEIAPRYRVLREHVETAIMSSVGVYQGSHRDPTLTWEALSQAPTLYARTRLGEIHDRGDLAASIRHRYADQLMPCLGLEFTWARELFDKGAFLLPSYVDTVRGADTPERILALRSDLLGRLRRDRAFIEEALTRRYLVLAVDEARLSIEGPTRIYVYDLNDGRPLLRARNGGDSVVLVPFRIAGLPGPPASAPRGRGPSVNQHDCSAAQAVRDALGLAAPGLTHVPEPESEATDASVATDASRDR